MHVAHHCRSASTVQDFSLLCMPYSNSCDKMTSAGTCAGEAASNTRVERTRRSAERAWKGWPPPLGMGPLGGVVGADWLPDCSQHDKPPQTSHAQNDAPSAPAACHDNDYLVPSKGHRPARLLPALRQPMSRAAAHVENVATHTVQCSCCAARAAASGSDQAHPFTIMHQECLIKSTNQGPTWRRGALLAGDGDGGLECAFGREAGGEVSRWP